VLADNGQSRGLCPQHLQLRQLAGVAADHVARKPRATVENCYRPYLDTAAYAGASVADREHYLYEYLQACQLAAKSTAEKKPREEFYREASNVAQRYIELYLSSRSPAQWRVPDVVFQAGDVNAEILDWGALLDLYDRFARTNIELLSDQRAITTWLKALRYYDAPRERDATAARRHAQEDSTYRDDWLLFKQTVDALGKRHAYGLTVERALNFARRVSP
jgi:hypothetical protein